MPHPRDRTCAFTLIELLVTIAVIAVLVGILLPALSSSREAGRGAVCLSNLRQMFIACRAYANDHDGIGPAIGQPYAALPNWALVVQSAAGRDGRGAQLYSETSSLVCPTVRAHYGTPMTRTYAMNATGHAGAEGDRGNFDSVDDPGFIRFDLVKRTSDMALLLDSAAAVIPGPAPPPTRTASVIDFRNAAHVPARIGFFHGGSARRFQWSAFDGSARAARDVPELWVEPLP